ncbi:hypothetical protein DVR12_00070 [Chitinophaga silvatica]|uniref:Uncharacterized protein n=2 Tax=Chitinophaga silvatica TaxID=2282649 RepID=A0A3E1YFS7_9BACT|nr:hypothetical protein DVR12_00070 [Chitinophaga silvatica]
MTFYGGRAFQSSQQIEPADLLHDFGKAFNKAGDTVAKALEKPVLAVGKAIGAIHNRDEKPANNGGHLVTLPKNYLQAMGDPSIFFKKAKCLEESVEPEEYRCVEGCRNSSSSDDFLECIISCVSDPYEAFGDCF